MVEAWFLFGLLWIVYAWIGLHDTDPSNSASKIQVFEPIFKQSCESKPVACVDDCSFLCIEDNTQCIGGQCVPYAPSPIPCDQQKGGILLLDATPKWVCLCTNPTIWSGPECNQLNPDVCQHGMFVYYTSERYQCVCPFPYRKITTNGKEYCVEKHFARFLSEGQEYETPIGPCPLPPCEN